MRVWIAFATIALAGGCNKDEGHYPVIVGGNPGVGNSGADARSIADASHTDAGAAIQGLVCLLPDPRDQTTCATTGAGGLSVKLDGVTVMTAANGAFSMPLPAGTNLTWQVSGTAMTTSIMGFSALAEIPVIATSVYQNLETSNGIFEQAGQGAIFARVRHANAPLTSAAASSTPIGAYAVVYDGNNATTWNSTSTGPFGTAWLPGLASGTSTTLTITPMGGTAIPIPSLPIGDGAITFVTLDVP